MKIQFNGYEIEIKARHSYDDRATKSCVLELLNNLSILYNDSADLHEKLEAGDGIYSDYAELQRSRSNELYKICKDNNFYN